MVERPVQLGQTHEVEALRLNDDGHGVASIHGFTVFVPDLLPGERGLVEITAVERRFARAQLVGGRSVDAAQRTVPQCQVFGACGGCQLQHLSYPEQLRHKREMVTQALRRLAKLDVPVRPTLGMAEPWRYRNQVQVPLRFDPAIHRLRQGFFGPSSHRLVETNHCRLEPEAMEDTIQSAVSMLNTKLGDVAQPIHHLIVRQSFATQEQMLILCVRQPGVLALDVVRALMNLPHVVTVAETVQPRPHGPVWGKDVRILAGSPHLVERIGPLEFLISPRSFFQVNTAQAEVLYREALAAADVQAEDTVLDAYCGTGTLSLMFASKAQRVVGIETIAAAVHDARKNAKHNGMDNVEFIVGEVERVLPEQIRGGAHYDIALLDPPRKGCHPAVLHSLASARPRKIVYVSCNHVTLARDLRMLADAGYEVSYVQPVDMFPQTGHVECCSLLVRKDVAR